MNVKFTSQTKILIDDPTTLTPTRQPSPTTMMSKESMPTKKIASPPTQPSPTSKRQNQQQQRNNGQQQQQRLTTQTWPTPTTTHPTHPTYIIIITNQFIHTNHQYYRPTNISTHHALWMEHNIHTQYITTPIHTNTVIQPTPTPTSPFLNDTLQFTLTHN